MYIYIYIYLASTTIYYLFILLNVTLYINLTLKKIISIIN